MKQAMAKVFAAAILASFFTTPLAANDEPDTTTTRKSLTVYSWPADTPLSDTAKTSWGQLGKLAIELEAGQYFLLSDDTKVFGNGDGIDFSGRSESGTHTDGFVLETGVWFFPEGSVLLFENGETEVLGADTVITRDSDFAPHSFQEASTLASDGSCTVTCTDGYYACCTHRSFLRRANCVCNKVNEDDDDCEAGGTGAVACSVGPQDSAINP